MNKNKIIGFVFDTTSVNSGIHSGIIVRLERYFGRKLPLFACRHHIFELTCGGACKLVYGETTNPVEPVFTKMHDNWSEINSTNYNILDVSSLPRFIKSQLENVLEFLEKWIRTSHYKSLDLRKDYRELAVLAVMLLGGSLPCDL